MTGSSGIPWLDKIDREAKAAGEARRENAQSSESEVSGLDLYREHHGDGYRESDDWTCACGHVDDEHDEWGEKCEAFGCECERYESGGPL